MIAREGVYCEREYVMTEECVIMMRGCVMRGRVMMIVCAITARANSV